MSFPRYPAYKDSGVEWLGEVPEHWDVVPLKHLAFSIKAGPFGSALTKDMYVESGYRVYGQEQVIPEDFTVGNYYINDDRYSELEQYAVTSGDVLISCVGTFGKIAVVPDNIEAGIINPRLIRVRPNDVVFPQYLAAVLRSQVVFQQFSLLSRGGTMDVINIGTLSGIVLAIPPTNEQSEIASVLDRETAKIDALVAEYRTLIELLKEKRQAVISHAVTKGLDPTVRMKDSGVEWLGEVPEHWEVSRLKRISPQITVGVVVEPSKYYVQDDGIPALRSLNILPGKIDLENAVLISTEANDALSKSRLSAGDLVAVRSGQPGTTAVVPEEMSGFNCIDLIIIRRPANMLEHYLCWFMNSDAAQHQFSEGSGGAIQQHFNIGSAVNLLVPEPPAAEQKSILAFLVDEATKLDTLTAEAEQAISLLQERRTALISAAVTGKIDVRGLVGQEVAA